jgi:hypothetical protein
VLRRRTVLFGLGGALLLAGGGAAVALSSGYAVAPGDVPIATTAKELAIVRAIVEGVLPADGDLPAGVDLGVVQRIDEELWSMPPHLREDLKSALSVLEYWPLLTGWGRRLTRLAPADRAAVLEAAMAKGPRPVAQAASALKQMCHLFYYASDATWAGIGYDGPWVKTPKPPPSSVAYRALVDAARRGA